MDISFDLSNIIGLSSTAITLIGVLYVIFKKRVGFVLSSFGNLGWLLSEMQKDVADFWFLVTCGTFLLINSYGWFRWSKNKCDRCTQTLEVVDDLIKDVDAVGDKLRGLKDDG